MKRNVHQALRGLLSLGKWTRGMLLALAGLTVLWLGLFFSVMFAAGFLSGSTEIVVGQRETWQVPVAIGYSLVTLLTLAGSLVASVLSLVWIYRANANLHLLGLEGLNYRPGWAVGSFFVPGLNLFVPMRIMRELCNRSAGEEAHFAAQSVPDVMSWWTMWLCTWGIWTFVIAKQVMWEAFRITLQAPPAVEGILNAFAVLLFAGSAWFLSRIVHAVSTSQQAVTGIGETFA